MTPCYLNGGGNWPNGKATDALNAIRKQCIKELKGRDAAEGRVPAKKSRFT